AGPWGRMVLGTDTKWYPLGLQQLVRMEASGPGFIAYTADGSVWTFGATERIEISGRGTYAWYLESVVSVTGRRTEFQYQHNASGRRFLKKVLYGGVGTSFPQNQIEFFYQSLTKSFEDYRPGFPYLDELTPQALRLDARVRQVVVSAKNGVQWAE